MIKMLLTMVMMLARTFAITIARLMLRMLAVVMLRSHLLMLMNTDGCIHDDYSCDSAVKAVLFSYLSFSQ